MNRIIIDFMSQQTCMTVCCLDANGLPYCFNCYFIYDNLHMRLIYKSSASAEHSKHIANNGHVSGTILPNHIRKFAVKGVQFFGEIEALDAREEKYAAELYYGKFPIARVMNGVLNFIMIKAIKMTDSTLGIVNKIAWDRAICF
ncbi:MAG: pyridoxamine 5'-phosphate oxidase family protein [Bacteroidetes bacterium]|jgi:uncharacterized protein YhbP (UPF0306 family)|nr:pyridoxamine 5'-phosphate oxidase family protein [Bacteroidota bacterium]MBK6818591.1 pyridoxamine 5'-phosphate oxidase family protein [Bacteroidota bacterium]MBK7041230.1 pyridoxamine 5'-phosphate oxidase family protein [Bacteroidota bacterium]MBK7588613.1 pyridoxamine 5'-phosphate oxidase family protein [Bacteroidota bacterium]MBK8328701.1 pyridoxamine 5'-phosphate oxidase family protein [Bacteroidota bacterium]